MMRWAGLVSMLALGCGPQVEIADTGASTGASTSDASASTMTMATASTRPADAGDDDGSVDVDVDDGFPDWGTVGVVCPGFACGQGVDCSVYACGDPFSPFDEEGCLRPPCPCAANEVCFTPVQWGGCASSSIECSEQPECVCGGTDDCGGSYCLAADMVPPVPCLDLEDAADCEAANCFWLAGAIPVTYAGPCGCGLVSGICVQPLEYRFTPGGPAAFYRIDDDDRGVLLPGPIAPTPFGLFTCDGADLPVCDCAQGC